ncbi:hypothetical protein GJ496_001883 [Pomphorhynchus laevis]|nr:hypothetical protein GJ496_001883 [Pomphorhynchus laevis]
MMKSCNRNDDEEQSHKSFSKMDLHLLPKESSQEHMMGTTIMAIEYDGGVIMAADTRTSIGTFVFNRYTDKITKLTDSVYCCRSGSAADTQAIAEIVSYQANLYSLESNEELTVNNVANMAKRIAYANRNMLLAGLIIAGWDKVKGGQVYAIPLGGMLARQPIAMGGSGSTYLWGYMDSQYKPGMSKEDAIEFVRNAVTLAIGRDGSSGGCVRIAIISESGVKRDAISGNTLPAFYTD